MSTVFSDSEILHILPQCWLYAIMLWVTVANAYVDFGLYYTNCLKHTLHEMLLESRVFVLTNIGCF